MNLLSSRPSRNYAAVEHNPDGLSSAGDLPFRLHKAEGSFKTYKPSIVETHLRRPDASLAPLPPAFQSHRHRKEAARAGQRAELDRILAPEYKSTHTADLDSASIPGPSRGGVRTAGGLAADRKGKSIRSSSSVGSFRSAGNKLGVGGGGGAGSGTYLDSAGKLHDNEYDPFAKVSEMSRDMSRRRSAFGSDRRKGSGSSSSSDGAGDGPASGGRRSAESGRSGRDREEEEIRRRLEGERRRLDEVSGYAAARRRSMVSDRASLGGRGAPSVPSNEDTDRQTVHSAYSYGLGDRGVRSKSSPGYHVRSPLSPTFGVPSSAQSYTTARTLPATPEDLGGDEAQADAGEAAEVTDGLGHLDLDTQRKESQSGRPSEGDKKRHPQIQRNGAGEKARVKERDRHERVEIRKDGSRKVTGFDAPSSPMPQLTPSFNPQLPQQSQNSAGSMALRVPDSARSAASRASSESHRPKPAERAREDLFPETPAQMKLREERAARANRGGLGLGAGPSRHGGLAVDTALAGRTSTRVLPEIEIVEDDDPRIIIPAEGRTTRVQTNHDHVIRGPFSLAMHAVASGDKGSGTGVGLGIGVHGSGEGDRRPSSTRSVPFSGGAVPGSGPSSILEEGPGGYLPSRWASGDKQLRRTEEEKEVYRPTEWGGKMGDLAGKPEEWKPTAKEQMKKTWKDVQTGARFSLFRATKKLGRKADL